jgi:hypothetical protein
MMIMTGVKMCRYPVQHLGSRFSNADQVSGKKQFFNLMGGSGHFHVGTSIFHIISGSSSFGRAIAFQAIGGEFEPRLPLGRKIMEE